MTSLRLLGLWGPVGLFMAVLFWLSSRSDLPSVASGWDKVAHAGAYTVLGTLALRACHGGLMRPRVVPTLLGLVVTAGYGLVDEWHQASVPGRDANAMDWVADAAGTGISVGAFGVLERMTGGDRARSERSGEERDET